MADRILGMGDIVTLVEQAQEKLDMEVQQKTAKRMQQGVFTFNDLLDQFGQIQKMGSMQNMLKMIREWARWSTRSMMTRLMTL